MQLIPRLRVLRLAIAVVAFAGVFLAPLAAQQPLGLAPAGAVADYAYQSPPADNADTAPAVVAEHAVQVAGASALSLQFGPCALGPAGVLELEPDGGPAIQLRQEDLDAADGWSPFLGGSRVTVRLVAGPGTQGVSFAIARSASLTTPPGGSVPEAICLADQRVLNSDLRSVRLIVILANASIGVCSGFLCEGVNLVATAGHCFDPAVMGSSVTRVIAEVNTPPSSSTGAITPSAPQDQYEWSGPSLVTWNNQGIGKDWAVLLTRRNPFTNLHIAQTGAGFRTFYIGNANPNDPVTAIGCGEDLNDPTRNSVQQSMNGLCHAISNNTGHMIFSAHISPGSSGGAVIRDAQLRDTVIGIATHSCTTISSFTGFVGTMTNVPAFVAARNAMLNRFLLGSVASVGSGCTGSYVPVCHQANGSATPPALRQQTAADFEIAMKITPSAPISVQGFEILASATGVVTVFTRLWSDNAGHPDLNLDNGVLTINNGAGWYRTSFGNAVIATPTNPIWIGFRNSNPSIVLNLLTTGTMTTGATKPPSSSTWSVFPDAWAFRVLCGGAGLGKPLHTIPVTPEIGYSSSMRVDWLPPGAPCFLNIGGSLTTWQGIPLPYPLAAIGAPSCYIINSQDITLGTAANGTGAASIQVAVPANPSMIGAYLYSQWTVLDPPANALGVTMSNSLQQRFGGAQ